MGQGLPSKNGIDSRWTFSLKAETSRLFLGSLGSPSFPSDHWTTTVRTVVCVSVPEVAVTVMV